MTWGLRKKFADGKFSVGYSRFLGYDKGEDGNLAINEEQAKTVRLIFGLFIEGLTPCAIAKELTKRGILTITGKSKWNAATINGVLANETYTGCARTSASCASLAEFDERLWGAMVDYMTVGADGGMKVVFRDGTALSM